MNLKGRTFRFNENIILPQNYMQCVFTPLTMPSPTKPIIKTTKGQYIYFMAMQRGIMYMDNMTGVNSSAGYIPDQGWTSPEDRIITFIEDPIDVSATYSGMAPLSYCITWLLENTTELTTPHYIMTKRGNLDNVVTYEFVCDTATDLLLIEPQYITMGSIATVIQGDTGFEAYMANSQGEWILLNNADTESKTINKDVIRSIPENLTMIIDGNESPVQANMSLDDHTITGQLTNTSPGYMGVIMNTSIPVLEYTGTFTPLSEDNIEYYLICEEYNDQISALYTALDTNHDITSADNGVFIGVYSDTPKILFYKMPDYIINHVMTLMDEDYDKGYALFSYICSIIKPEATYTLNLS